MRAHTKSLALCAAIVSLALPSAAGTTPPYPDKPITIVVPYGPKSDTADYAHLLATQVNKYLDGIELIEVVRAGDSGAKAATEVMLTPADGYTLMMGRVGSQAISPALKPNLPYRWHDFTFIGVIEIDPLICAVRSDSPYKTVRDLAQAIRKKPGTLKYSTVGTGTIQNISVQYLMKLSGLVAGSIEGVGFPGGPEAAAALLDGRVAFICTSAVSLVQPIKGGKLRAFFTTAPGRLPELPDIQNAREVGLRDMSALVGWSALIGPPGLPETIVARWRAALKKLATDKEWISEITKRGAIPAIGTSKDNDRFIKEQYELYDWLAQSLGLQE